MLGKHIPNGSIVRGNDVGGIRIDIYVIITILIMYCFGTGKRIVLKGKIRNILLNDAGKSSVPVKQPHGRKTHDRKERKQNQESGKSKDFPSPVLQKIRIIIKLPNSCRHFAEYIHKHFPHRF